MTRVGRMLRNTLERLLGRFHEGPEAPARFTEEVRLFQIVYPTATAEEWESFARALAEKAYREGYVRGLEWTERDLERRDPEIDPEVLAEHARHDWSLADHDPRMKDILRDGDPNDPLRGVPPEARAQFLDQIGMMTGGFRVVVVEGDGPPKPDQET